MPYNYDIVHLNSKKVTILPYNQEIITAHG